MQKKEKLMQIEKNVKREPMTLSHKDMCKRMLFSSCYKSKNNILKNVMQSESQKEDPRMIIVNYDELFSLSTFRYIDYKHLSTEDIVLKEPYDIKKEMLDVSISNRDQDKILLFDVPDLNPFKFQYINNLIFINLMDLMLETNVEKKPCIIINGLLEHIFKKETLSINQFFYSLSSQSRALGVPVIFIEKINSNEIIDRSEKREDVKAILANIYIKREANRINILNT